MEFLKRLKAPASASASTSIEQPKEQEGLFSIHEPPNADIDIVAVHGLDGHPMETWTDTDSKQLWLRDFLPSQLKDVGIATRVMSYGYNAGTFFSNSVTDVEDQAKMLLQALNLERQSPSEKERPLIFIAHSLGGIIVKKIMIIAHELSKNFGTLLGSVRALVFFGVPHRGSDLAYWSALAAKLMKNIQLRTGTNTSFIEALKRNSQTFTDISQSFIERAAPLKIITFFETERLKGNVIVDKDSARLGLPNEIVSGVQAANHETICKFKNKDDVKYRPVWKTIQGLCVEIEGDKASNIIKLIDHKFKNERRVALTGIGGVGKSQIAIEYCYRYRDNHPDSNIFWVHAGTKERFEQAFKAIARKCKLPGWDNPAQNPLDLVYDWLSADNHWLMILDNADDKDVFFKEQTTNSSQNPNRHCSTVPISTYLPQTSRRGSILITSRNTDAAFRLINSVEDMIDVPYMSRDDATALLCTKLPNDHSSDAEKFELVELLEYLPLAITQAASFISSRRTRMTIARYSEFLKQNERILLKNMGDLRRDPTVPSSVLLTWHISFDQIKKENRPAAELLSIMSIFDRQGVPQFLLQGRYGGKLDFENRLAPLEEFSLISVEDSWYRSGDILIHSEDIGRIFQIHRLVHMAIRSWLEQHGEIDHWKQNAAELIAERLESLLPVDSSEFWDIWEILLPHCETISGYVLSSSESQLRQAEILHNSAQYFNVRGRYEIARERCQRALEIRRHLLDEDGIEIAVSSVLLAVLKTSSSGCHRPERDEAETICRRAVDTFERERGKNSHGSMVARNNLAIVLLNIDDDRRKAETTKIFRSVLFFGERILGLEHPDTLTFMENLASALVSQHKDDEAEKYHRKSLEVRLRVFGEDYPGTMRSRHNLARLLFRRKRYEESYKLAQDALNWTKRYLGEGHKDSLWAMRLLSSTLNCQDKNREAEELCRHALVLHKAVLSDRSQEIMECSATLGRILAKQHKYDEAEELLREVCNSPSLGWVDLPADTVLEAFADTLAGLGKHDEAAEVSRRRVRVEDASSSDWETTDDSSSDLEE